MPGRVPGRMDRLHAPCRRHLIAVVRFLEVRDRLQLRRYARHQRSEDPSGENLPVRPRRRLLTSDDRGIKRVNVCFPAGRAHEFGD